MPLTLADVFLGLGSGFGGTGFCRNNLNYTNTETDAISTEKEDKWVETATSSAGGSVHLGLVLSV